MKSKFVPRTRAEGKEFFSEVTELTDMATGAAAETLSSFWIAVTSVVERLDFWKELVEVSSSTMLVTVSLVELGRTTIKSAPMLSISVWTRLAILPMRERMRIMLATPMAMPIQVRKERVRCSLIEVLASLK